jgi:hypothetical protein
MRSPAERDSDCQSEAAGAAVDIKISLHSGTPVWRPAANGLDGAWTLDDAIGEFLIDQVSVLPASARVRLVVYLSSDEASRNPDVAAAIRTAIRADFARRRQAAECQLLRARRTGWVSLFVGSLVLLVLVSLVEAIHEWAPPGRVATMLEEGLTIVAWVELWRPVELLLYDQRPIKGISSCFPASSVPTCR